MAEGAGDLVIRTSAADGQRGTPLIVVGTVIVLAAWGPWFGMGMPLAGVFWPVVGAAVGVAAVVAGTRIDAVTVVANSQQVVLTRWRRAPVVMPVGELAAIQLSSQERRVQIGSGGRFPTTGTRTVDSRIVSFVDKNGQIRGSVSWDQFSDDDLDRLSKWTGLPQDGGWFYKESA